MAQHPFGLGAFGIAVLCTRQAWAAQAPLCWRRLTELSTGRQYMGAAMLDSPGVVMFAGGLVPGDQGNLDGTVDIIAQLDPPQQPLQGQQALSLPRTDIGSVATARAVYFAGGCGIAQPDNDVDSAPPPPHLSVKNCQPSDNLDIFTPGASTGDGRHGDPVATASAVTATTHRLNEPKYAATTGVFWTGRADEGTEWATTPHVMVAGGIIPASVGGNPTQYTATDTVDIIREDSVDPVTNKVHVSILQVQRLPYPPRFDMSSCCFKHICVLAGGRVSMDGFYSDRVEVWDAKSWAFQSSPEHTLSEARYSMGTATIEISLAEGKRAVGMFAGGVSNTGSSLLVDMYDFHNGRVMPRMVMPAVSGPTSGVILAREVAAFVSDTGEIDIFNGTSLCWLSYKIDDMPQGASVVGRSALWFFNASSPGRESGHAPLMDSSAYVGGGIHGPGGDISVDVNELRWKPGGRLCVGNQELRPRQRVCGKLAPGGAINDFTPHEEEPLPVSTPVTGAGDGAGGGTESGGNGGADNSSGDSGLGPGRRTPGGVAGTGVGVGSVPGGTGGLPPAIPPGTGDQEQGLSAERVSLYVLVACVALITSYMVSATIIIRQVEGIWRMPLGGGACDILCRACGALRERVVGCCLGAARGGRGALKGDRYAYQAIQRGNGGRHFAGAAKPEGDTGGPDRLKDIEAVVQSPTSVDGQGDGGPANRAQPNRFPSRGAHRIPAGGPSTSASSARAEGGSTTGQRPEGDSQRSYQVT